MSETTIANGGYILRERIAEGGMAYVYRAETIPDRFDYTLLYAYTQVQQQSHKERRRAAERFAQDLSGKTLDLATVRAILETHGIPLPGPEVAVKIAKPGTDTKRFAGEWKNLICLSHESVIEVYGGGMEQGQPYYVMELLPGVVATKRVVKEFPFARKLELMVQACRGLHYLNERGIVHRDVKMDNLLVCEPEPGVYRVKVADLGIAKDVDDSQSMTVTRDAMGTPFYMAPEQIRSAKSVDRRADIYSLGATLYYLVTGKPPYHERATVYEVIHAVVNGESPIPPREFNEAIPQTICRIIACAMATKPEERYQSLDEMAADLERFLDDMAIDADQTMAAGVTAAPDSTSAITTRPYCFETRGGSPTMDAKDQATGQAPPGGGGKLWIGLAAAVLAILAIMGGLYAAGIVGGGPEGPEAPTYDVAAYQAAIHEARGLLREESFAEARAAGAAALRIKPGDKDAATLVDLATKAEENRRLQMEAWKKQGEAMKELNNDSDAGEGQRPPAGDPAKPTPADEPRGQAAPAGGAHDAEETAERPTRPASPSGDDAGASTTEAKPLPVPTAWPFDEMEAMGRQRASAKALGLERELRIELGPRETLVLMLIPPGEFEMGTPGSAPLADPDERPLHRVRISEAFYLARAETTQGQWRSLVGGNPSFFEDHDDSRLRPVEQVSYLDIHEKFLPKLARFAPAGWRFRLPTEAEWEYACRAGTATAYSFGDKASSQEINLKPDGGDPYNDPEGGLDRKQTLPVATLPTNAWGLANMHGNVAEWVADTYAADYYGRAPKVDPRNDEAGASRVIRGGSYGRAPFTARSAARYSSLPKASNFNHGFRVALVRDAGDDAPTAAPNPAE